MTTHLRARAVQAGALLALVSGILVVAPSAALADAPDVQITDVESSTLNPGDTTTVAFTVTNKNNNQAQFQMNVSAGAMQCIDGCSPAARIDPGDGGKKQFVATLKAPQVNPGQNTTFTIQVTAKTINGNDSGQDTQQVTVRGSDKPQTVRQVNGRVKDPDGKSVSGATVGVRDSQSHQYQVTSNDEGRFSFTSTDAAPILTGNLFVGAVKDKFSPVTVQVQGSAGKVLNVSLTMKPLETAATAAPSASVTVNAPTDDATDPATEAAAPPATDTKNASQNTDNGASMLYIVLGALLVAAGIGAIVLLVMRRRNKGDDPDDPNGGGGPGGPVPPSQGRFNGVPDATRIAAPVGGRMNDTMLAGRSGPSIADAPTMMQQAVPMDDEFPDPYGVPAAPHGGYAGAGGYGTTAAAGAYGGAQAGGYDAGPPTQYGGPVAQEDDPYGAYGAPQGGAPGYGGAGAQPRYDEPTGMYRPEPADGGYGRGGQEQGYEAGGYGGADYGREPEYPPAGRGRGETSGAYQAGAYQGGGGGYGGGQDQQWADDNAYGQPAGGYGPPAAGTYGGGAPGSYGGGDYGAPAGGRGGRPAGDYGDQGGYDPRSTYGRPEQPPAGGGYGGGQPPAAGGYGGDGYDDEPYGGGAQGGYYGADQGGGRHGGQPRQQPPAPPQESSRPGQRRGLDWLDD